jgi:anti-anti-sigma factor
MDDLEAETEPIMSFDVAEPDTGSAIVTIAGELDIAGVDSLQSEVAGVLAKEPTRLIVDVGRVRFADSSAIALWVRWAGAVSQFELRDPPPLLRKVVTAMGLAETLGLAQ